MVLKSKRLRTPTIKRKQLLGYLTIFVVTPILTYMLGKRLDVLLNLPSFPPFPINLMAGPVVFAYGLLVGIKSTKMIYREGFGLPWGEAKKDVQTRVLVKSGLYAHTRNPMILGYSLLPCGMGIALRSISISILITLAVVIVNVAIVKIWEEPNLERRFGQEYLKYKEETPFLVPRPRGFIRLAMEAVPSEDKDSM